MADKKKNASVRTGFTVSSINEIVRKNALENPTRASYMYMKGSVDMHANHEAIKNVVDAARVGFEMLGMEGTRVAVVGDKSVELVACYLAAMCVPASAVYIDPALDPEVQRAQINEAKCECVVFTRGSRSNYIGRQSELPKVRFFIQVDTNAKFIDQSGNRDDVLPESTTLDYATFIKFGFALHNIGKASPMPAPKPDKECAVFFDDEGNMTTMTQKEFFDKLNEIHAAVEYSGEDLFVSVQRLGNINEMFYGILAPLMAGASVAFGDNGKNSVRDIKKYRPDVLHVTVAMLDSIYEAMKVEAAKNGGEGKFDKKVALVAKLKKFHLDLSKKQFANELALIGGRVKKMVCVANGAEVDAKMLSDFDAMGIKVIIR